MKQTMPSGRRQVAGSSNGSVAVESQFKNRMPPGHSFPARMPLGQFLFAYLYRSGVRHSFGVPGDFALPTFAWLEKSKIESVTMLPFSCSTESYSCSSSHSHISRSITRI